MSHSAITIHLSFQQLVDAVRKLQPSEKLALNEVLWNDDATIPSEHQQIVLDRIAQVKTNPERLVDWAAASKDF
jgi:Putative addiction module component